MHKNIKQKKILPSGWIDSKIGSDSLGSE